MTFYDAINTCIAKYAVFRGRAIRAEFFWFAGAVYFWATIAYWFDYYIAGGVLMTFVVLLIAACPVLAVLWRRFHDAGLSGWLAPAIYLGLFLLGYAYWRFAPGDIYHLPVQRVIEHSAWLTPVLLAALPSQPGSNKYGPNPHEVIL